MSKIPKRFQGIFWSVPVEKLDLEKHQAYIIHQILMYGTLADIRWLLKTYPKGTILEIFKKRPQKIYTKEAFNFIKNFVLDLKEVNLPLPKYVNSLHQRS